LAGSLSLITLAESDIIPRSFDTLDDLERHVFIRKCFNSFCQSAAKNFAELKGTAKLSPMQRRHDDSAESETDTDKLVERILTDLNAARLITRFQCFEMSFFFFFFLLF
jgi:hypothetical protein